MEKLRAIIVGAGRMGVGYGDWGPWPYVYTHADTYKELNDRVELVGIVEKDQERLTLARAKYEVAGFDSVDSAFSCMLPDIVSICTPPNIIGRIEIITTCLRYGVKGIWCEKPYTLTQTFSDLPIQVNYIRRFDGNHIPLFNSGRTTELWVWAKKDIHTVCHFTDLARYWGVPKKDFHYFHMDGPNSYIARESIYWRFFPLGGMDGGFMQEALSNLINAIKGEEKLVSPASSAIESEKWAEEILNEAKYGKDTST